MAHRARTSLAQRLSGGLVLGLLASGGCSLEFAAAPRALGLAAASEELLSETPEGRAALLTELERAFGSREAPLSPLGNADSLRAAASLYASKCLHCHGNEGGGDGPTSYTARPYPRDFRLGIFKYDDLLGGARPEQRDLVEVIRDGIEGTGMPSLAQLSEAELAGLADYVRWLAMRGELEARLAPIFADEASPERHELDRELAEVVASWRDAQRERPAVTATPPATPERIARGFELYHDGSRAACASCHGPAGRGPGPAAFGPSPTDPEGEETWLLVDAWGHAAIPTDLRHDHLRHGDALVEIYARLACGIDGTPMAGLLSVRDAAGNPLFDDEELWSLVHYVRALREDRWSDLLDQLERETP